MAALICESFSKLCSSCTDVCGSCCQIIVEPCRQVGTALRNVVCSPFFSFLLVTLLCNVPPLVSSKLSCTWTLVNSGFCLVNIIACFYMVHRLQKEKVLIQAQVVDHSPAATAADTTSKTDYQTMPTTTRSSEVRLRESAADRVKQVLCYDAGVASYIVIFVVWMIWLTYGFQQAIVDSDDVCGILYCIFCAMCYIMIAGCAFACSLLCLK